MASIYNISNWDNTSQSYSKNEVVLNSADEKHYYCLQAHTSSTTSIHLPSTASSAYWGGTTPYGTANEIIPHFFWVPSYAPSISSEPMVIVPAVSNPVVSSTVIPVAEALIPPSRAVSLEVLSYT